MKITKKYLNKIIKEELSFIREEEVKLGTEPDSEAPATAAPLKFGSVEVPAKHVAVAKEAFTLLMQGKASAAQQKLKQLQANDMGRVAIAAMVLDVFANWDESELQSAMTQSGITASRTAEK